MSGSPPADLVAHALVASVHSPTAGVELTRHLWSSRRLKPGTQISITDGAGSWRLARVGAPGVLEPDGEVTVVPAPEPVTVAFAPVKGERPEWCVQKLTEVGVDRVVVLQTDRSVVRWTGERGRGHLAKLERVAAAALEQCRRVWLPAIVGPFTLDELLDAAGDGGGAPPVGPWVRADGDGRIPTSRDRSLLIGPEGGFSPRERELVHDSVSLGPHVLRAETAAMVAGAQAVALRENEVRANHAALG
ncbi:MAG: 16S rRNA (uracil(1498)-N(3))-methyltransferase [Microthrixaceae bacterium]|nr:16S rRNA (uracil(1498)-N(3))-methyltransferase [Microthrixaceae bacterium]